MKKLRESFGDVNFSDKDCELQVYSSDASLSKGKTDAVVWPTSIEKVHELVNYCKRSKICINIRGGGTSLAGGCVPSGGIVADMSKLNKISEISDDFAVAEAGVVLENLNRKLDKTNSFFPIIPGSAKACTIGGMIATNAFGLKTMEYGRMSDWVEEIDVVDGSGKFIKVKGYALAKFCGTEGASGIIVRAKLKLAPKPRQRSIDILKFNTITAMAEKIEELKKNENVKNIIYIDEICSDLIDFDERNHLVVEYDTNDGRINSEKEKTAVWQMLDSIRHRVVQQKFTRVEDPFIPPHEIGKFLYWLKKNQIPCYGPVGAGVVYTFFHKNSSEVEEMYSIVNTLKGKISYGHGFGTLKRSQAGKNLTAKIMAVKQIHDPDMIMNMGKII